MKHSHIIESQILFIIFLFFAAGIIQPVDGKQPKLNFPESNWDFGSVTEGSKFEHEFIVENAGDDILKAQRILGSCACFKVSIEKTELAPGEKIVYASSLIGIVLNISRLFVV